MRMQKIGNIVRAISYMGEPAGVTISELADELDISKITAGRLIQVIEARGYPLSVTKDSDGRTNRWRFNNDFLCGKHPYKVPNFCLQLSEVLALQLLYPQAKMFNGSQIGKSLEGVFSRLDEMVPDKLSHSFERLTPLFASGNKYAKDYSNKEQVIEALVGAILGRSVCEIVYHSYSREKEIVFRIDPLSFFEHLGGMYLFVRSSDYASIRVLALERIKKVVVTEDTFKEVKDFVPENALSKSLGATINDPVYAEIKITPAQVKYIKERPYYAEKIIRTESDGSVVLAFDVSGKRDLVMWVLSLGAGAEVLEPKEFRLEVANEIKKMLEQYR
ncbi:MAG: WYL domain-containing transcriptional regulator [Desulfovibrionales bacterium]|nr:WYL domain-containing transcriptional regulator [Desulfovibrionales bacterium]